MRICYVLPRLELSGGLKVAFQQAEILRQRGYDVTVLGRGGHPDWSPYLGVYIDIARSRADLPRQDLVIATFWTTVEVAEALDIGPVVHYCQGYEADYDHLADQRGQIEAAYDRAHPAFVVSPHLAGLLKENYAKPTYLIPPFVESRFKPTLRLGPRREPWILIHGIFGCAWKGVPTALEAVRMMREKGQHCRVLRISLMEQTDEEKRLLAAERFVCQAPPEVVAREVRRCDLLLFASHPTEGFGLPMIEAMASGVPTVASRIPSTEFMGSEDLTLVPMENPDAFADAAIDLLNHPARWWRARRAGYRVTSRFRPNVVAEQLTAAIAWAIEQGQRQDHSDHKRI